MESSSLRAAIFTLVVGFNAAHKYKYLRGYLIYVSVDNPRDVIIYVQSVIGYKVNLGQILL